MLSIVNRSKNMKDRHKLCPTFMFRKEGMYYTIISFFRCFPISPPQAEPLYSFLVASMKDNFYSKYRQKCYETYKQIDGLASSSSVVVFSWLVIARGRYSNEENERYPITHVHACVRSNFFHFGMFYFVDN